MSDIRLISLPDNVSGRCGTGCSDSEPASAAGCASLIRSKVRISGSRPDGSGSDSAATSGA